MTYKLALKKWNLLEECLKSKGVTYEFPKQTNDGFIYTTGDPDGLSKYHIHSIEKCEGDFMVFEKLLTKSSNWRDQNFPDLVNYETSEWETVCTGMNSTVLKAIAALAECFESLGATHCS